MFAQVDNLKFDVFTETIPIPNSVTALNCSYSFHFRSSCHKIQDALSQKIDRVAAG